MKQKATELLPQTMVKNKVGEIGRLVTLTFDLAAGKPAWMIDWRGRGLETVVIDIVQTYELV